MPLDTQYPSHPQPTGTAGGEPQPVPYHVSPPWGEAPIYDEPMPHMAPMATPDPRREDDYLHNQVNLAYGHLAIALNWQNDDQYGYPPPGAPNVQDFQSGHTSIIVHNPSSEQGWGTDPAFAWPRYPHMENKFPGYNRNGIFRRNGQWSAEVLMSPLQRGMQYARDLEARRAFFHRQHGVVVADAPSVTHTANVTPVDPTAHTPVHVGLGGVMPG